VSLVYAALGNDMSLGSILLVAYWSLFIPILSRQLTATLKQFPSINNVAQRVFELLDAPEESAGNPAPPAATTSSGVALEFAQASVVRGELALLANISVKIRPGEQVAIVGESGSGKSTLLGAVLGWHPLRAGSLFIDGAVADATAIAELREQSVLIDPDLYLWNRSLFDSIRYGSSRHTQADFELALSGSEALNDLEQMDAGLATMVGENGSRLSGGEGQRLRIARGLVRADRRLVLLDEPFTGMDSAQRGRMMDTLMQRWPDATMLCVSHNVSETTGFERVLVLADGRIVEDGEPAALTAQVDSTYAGMLASEEALRQRLWDSPAWRHHVFADGAVHLQ
jgi:ABC-type multidrug transport system fused ATPase/permease subunit